MKILVSACLLGQECKYNGGHNRDERVCALGRIDAPDDIDARAPAAGDIADAACVHRTAACDHELVSVCPEQLGGLSTPRPPAELQGEHVVNRLGEDVTAAFRTGAEEALRLARKAGCTLAILQPRSPSCGVHQVYDGSFSGTLVPGQGVTAALLREAGMTLIEPDEVETCLAIGGPAPGSETDPR